MIRHIVLASESKFRRELLKGAGVPFIAEKPLVDETLYVESSPLKTALKRAQMKALSLCDAMSSHLILGCDQTLELKGDMFFKVETVAEAREQLMHLQGKSHDLHSAFSLVFNGTVMHEEVVTCQMKMRTLRSEEIEFYLKTGEWRGTVGSYRYEGIGIQLFESVSGEGSAIVGLPLTQLTAALRELGVNPLLEPKPPWSAARVLEKI